MNGLPLRNLNKVRETLRTLDWALNWPAARLKSSNETAINVCKCSRNPFGMPAIPTTRPLGLGVCFPDARQNEK
eukprot:scaffold5903_cov39-Prasinocladus_malaysianus.AAC.1